MMTVLTDKTKDHRALFRQAEKFRHSGNALDCSVLIVLSACVWSSGGNVKTPLMAFIHERRHWQYLIGNGITFYAYKWHCCLYPFDG